ncbi:hypothetical protein [Maritalea sp.]|uniref:hypothetical protein n=1 Tax=Maritalea sp. TaxID=2003361 RepID=UPI003F4AB82F
MNCVPTHISTTSFSDKDWALHKNRTHPSSPPQLFVNNPQGLKEDAMILGIKKVGGD